LRTASPYGHIPIGRLRCEGQWSMVALMVCYTITSLWIIAQPIVKIR